MADDQGYLLDHLLGDYLVFLEGVCDSAEPAAVFEALLVLPSRRTREAAEAARFEVCLVFFAIETHLLSES